MIFDAFSIDLSIIPDHVKQAYKCKHNCLFIFTDSEVMLSDIRLLDGTLSLNGNYFSYMSMSKDTLSEFTPCQVIVHRIDESKWNALTSGFKNTYRSFLDQDAIINELDDLPFSSKDALISFFINEIFFSPNSGVMPIGIALLDSALQSLIPKCVLNTTYHWQC